MVITEVKVFPAKDGGRLKAYATVVFDNAFIIRDLKIIEGNKGLFVSMPSRKRKDGTFRDIVHPLNSDTRRMIEDRVIEEFNRVKELEESGQLVSKEEDYD
jgi:stage V sporulation protein G